MVHLGIVHELIEQMKINKSGTFAGSAWKTGFLESKYTIFDKFAWGKIPTKQYLTAKKKPKKGKS